MPGQLFLSSVASGRSIEVRRSDEVPDDFWRKVRAEWGQSGPCPGSAILVPVEVFASRNGWLPSTCRRYGVEPVLDPESRGVLRRMRGVRERLAIVRDGSEASPEVGERLAGSRFTRPLHDFQTRDASRMLQLENGANFSVPGAGKTTVELAVYESEREAGRVQQLLVVAPLSAFDAWREDAAAVLDRPDGPPLRRRLDPRGSEILLVNYQRLTSAPTRQSPPGSGKPHAWWSSTRPTG